MGMSTGTGVHVRVTVGSQRILEDVREAALAVRDVRALARQRHHALLQIGEALVDAHGLLANHFIARAARKKADVAEGARGGGG